MRRVAALALVIAGCGGKAEPAASRVVVAEEGTVANTAPPDAAPQPEPEPEPWVPDDPDSARAHYERGRQAYDIGDFVRAIEAFKLSYEASPRPEMLYNIAEAYRHLGDARHAVYFYRRYLSLDDDAPNRAAVEQKIQQLESAP